MRVAVIGAGPAGMTAALQLSRGGVEVGVYEAGPCVGGLARSLDLWGQRVDLGPHRFFSTDARVNRLWLDVVGREYAMVNRLTRIYYRRPVLSLPTQAAERVLEHGPSRSRVVPGELFERAVAPGLPTTDDVSFESWIVRRFGRRLFEMFFKSYSEKLWEIPCSELSADFAAQRIKKLSLPEAVKSALSPRSRSGTRLWSIAFPIRWAELVRCTKKMADRLRDYGGQIHLQCPVRRILHEDFDVQGIELQSGRVEYFDHVVSTMPLTNLVRGLADVPAGRASCR